MLFLSINPPLILLFFLSLFPFPVAESDPFLLFLPDSRCALVDAGGAREEAKIKSICVLFICYLLSASVYSHSQKSLTPLFGAH